MSYDDSDGAKKAYLEKQERYLGEKIKYAYNDHNEHGVVGVLVLEMARHGKVLYGEYSDMTDSIENFFSACDSAIVAAGSIGGKGKRDLLQNRSRMEYAGIPGGLPLQDMKKKEPGFGQQMSDAMGLSPTEKNLRDPNMSI